MTASIFSITIFLLMGVMMAGVPVGLSFLLWKSRRRATADIPESSISSKLEPYESGMPPRGSGRSVGFEYVIYAMLFLLFDVVALLLFLGAVALRHDRSEFLMPFVLLTALALLIVWYGAKTRDYLKI